MAFIKSFEPFYKRLGFEIDYLSLHVLINPEIKDFLVAKNVNNIKAITVDELKEDLYKLSYGESNLLEELDEIDIDSLSGDNIPKKSKNFFLKKYFNHPAYRYKCCICLDSSNKPLFLFIYRTIIYRSSKVLRIVDFVGSEKHLESVSKQLLEFVIEEKAEYLDFYQFGLNSDCLKKANFIDRNDLEELIIPNHFEPFDQKNVDLNCAYLADPCDYEKLRFYKGDGDQDRPNIL